MCKDYEKLRIVLKQFLYLYLIEHDFQKASAYLSKPFTIIGVAQDDRIECSQDAEKILSAKLKSNIIIQQIEINEFQMISFSPKRADVIANAVVTGIKFEHCPFSLLLRISALYCFQADRWLIQSLHSSAYYDYLKNDNDWSAVDKAEMKKVLETQIAGLFGDKTTGGILVTNDDEKRTILMMGDHLAQHLGYTMEEIDQVTKQNYHSLIEPRDLNFVRNSISFQLQSSNQYEAEYRLQRKDHSLIWVQEKGYLHKNESGKNILFSMIRDNEYYRKMEQCKLAQKATTFIPMSDGQVWIHDCTRQQRLDLSAFALSPEVCNRLENNFSECLKKNSAVQTEFRLDSTDHTLQWYRLENVPVFNDQKEIDMVVGKLTNINEAKKAQIQDATAARYDDITGLCSKKQLQYFVDQEMPDLGEDSAASFLIIDIDRFHYVNDRFGVAFGDTVLRTIVLALQKYVVKYQGYLSHIRGDQFVLFLKEISSGEVFQIADSICKDIRALYVGDFSDIQLTCSVGVVNCLKWCTNFEEMMIKALQALYRAKNMGKNMIMVYNGQSVGSEKEQSFIDNCISQSPVLIHKSTEQIQLWEWATGLLATSKGFNSTMKLLLDCLRRHFKLSCLYIKEDFEDCQYSKISFLTCDEKFNTTFLSNELYAYQTNGSEDSAEEKRYCTITSDDFDDRYQQALSEFESGKKDISLEYSIASGEDTIGCLVAIRESSDKFWKEIEIKIISQLAVILSPYLLRKRYCDKKLPKPEETDQEITGVCSLSLFLERVSRFLTDNPERTFVICYSNLGNYKEIIDRYGFLAAKEALQIFADLLSTGTMNRRLCVTHIADDKFASVLSATDLEMIKDYIFRNNNRIVKVFREKYTDINVYVSTGICEIERSGDGVLEAIQNADTARKSAKGQLKNTCRLFDDELRQQLKQENDMISDFEAALKSRELTLLLQPVFRISDGEMVGAETILYWKKDNQLIPLEKMDSFLEKNGFMVNVDSLAIKHVLKILQRWKNEERKQITLSVKLSRVEALDPNRAIAIFNLCKQYEIPISCLALEFSEKDIHNNPVQIKQLMNKLMRRGFYVCVNQFGGACSPLKDMVAFPANSVKLSSRYFENQNRSLYARTVLKHIIAMMKEMGLIVVCEDVETQEQVEFFQNLGCEEAQGTYYAEPMTVAEFEKKYLS